MFNPGSENANELPASFCGADLPAPGGADCRCSKHAAGHAASSRRRRSGRRHGGRHTFLPGPRNHDCSGAACGSLGKRHLPNRDRFRNMIGAAERGLWPVGATRPWRTHQNSDRYRSTASRAGRRAEWQDWFGLAARQWCRAAKSPRAPAPASSCASPRARRDRPASSRRGPRSRPRASCWVQGLRVP